MGTVAVRYIVQPQGDKNSILRIDAVYVEDWKRTVHPSNGSVESSEYKEFRTIWAQMELVKKETEEALRQKQEHIAQKEFDLSNTELLSTPSGDSESSSAWMRRREAIASRRSDGRLTNLSLPRIRMRRRNSACQAAA